jgi:hypothetical protein
MQINKDKIEKKLDFQKVFRGAKRKCICLVSANKMFQLDSVSEKLNNLTAISVIILERIKVSPIQLNYSSSFLTQNVRSIFLQDHEKLKYYEE